MKITCPECGASGNLPDHEIPEEGRFLSCPRCKHGFDVKKPRTTSNEYMIDTCPSCAYSTFGEERFSTCPKCGVNIKTFMDRQREEKARAREQELLTRKFSRDTAPQPTYSSPAVPSAPPPSQPEAKSVDIGEMIENMHPVNLIGWGAAVVGAIIAILGIIGLFDYFGTDYAAKINEQNEALGLPERASAVKIFFQFGFVPWIEFLYGAILTAVAAFFLQHKAQARQAMIWMSWALIVYVPAKYLVLLIGHFFDPSRPTFGTFAVEFFTMLVIGALVGVPLFIFSQYLDHKRIRSVVRL